MYFIHYLRMVIILFKQVCKTSVSSSCVFCLLCVLKLMFTLIDLTTGALWFCSHVDLWKHKNRAIKVCLWLISRKHASSAVFRFFYKKIIYKERVLSRTFTFQKICFICFNESPLKMMKKAFVSRWKLILFSRYLNFCLNLSVT